MLQRIQSVWLFLAAVCSFAGLKFPFFSGTTPDGIPSSTLEGTDSLALIILTIAIGVLSLLIIFLYKDRSMQLKLCMLALVLQIGLLLLYFKNSEAYLEGTYALTSVLQIAVLIFLFLAIKGIRKDNKIIKESNRLR